MKTDLGTVVVVGLLALASIWAIYGPDQASGPVSKLDAGRADESGADVGLDPIAPLIPPEDDSLRDTEETGLLPVTSDLIGVVKSALDAGSQPKDPVDRVVPETAVVTFVRGTGAPEPRVGAGSTTRSVGAGKIESAVGN